MSSFVVRLVEVSEVSMLVERLGSMRLLRWRDVLGLNLGMGIWGSMVGAGRDYGWVE